MDGHHSCATESKLLKGSTQQWVWVVVDVLSGAKEAPESGVGFVKRWSKLLKRWASGGDPCQNTGASLGPTHFGLCWQVVFEAWVLSLPC